MRISACADVFCISTSRTTLFISLKIELRTQAYHRASSLSDINSLSRASRTLPTNGPTSASE
jgi:hypothetical protein